VSSRSLLLISASLLFAGCAATIPRELRDARSAYNQAAEDPATLQKTPAKLYEAREALTVAERSFNEDGDTPETRDRAYIAMRKAQLATVLARTEVQLERAAHAKDAAREARDEKAALAAEQTESAAAQQQLEAERARRDEAERRATQATNALAKVASVKQETRGTVVTLSGSVLFASGKSKLLPAASSRLRQVADALVAGDPDSTFVVEGHTDSTGNTDRNQRLSEDRARAVRDFLVSRGVPADRIEAQGMGSTQPVADNSSAEGRANNRRVEIVIRPPSA
jgi:outer membrane protein OmpA-like peptidoglycan-associated protein